MVRPFQASYYLQFADFQINGVPRVVSHECVNIEKNITKPSSRYTDRIHPWLHYVPIQVDLSDLHDALVFFRGDGNGEGSHEDLGRKIAVAGREWSLKFWRMEDLNAYFFRYGLYFLIRPLLIIMPPG